MSKKIPHSAFRIPHSAVRILYFTQYYPPEVGATQTRAQEMCSFLAERGHRVTVITEVPNHPSGVIPAHYKGRLSERKLENGVGVLRLWVWASPEKNFKSRMRFYLSYMGMAALAGILLRGKYDVIYATSPPLFVGAAGLVSALARRIPFVFEVRDLWPESAVALGELNNRRAIAAAEKLETLLYRRASRVVAVTDGIRARLVERGVPASKTALITNGANTERFRYDEAQARAVCGKLGLNDKFVAMYAGIHGLAQGLETLVETANILREREDIEFLFVGEGPKKSELLGIKERLRLKNIRFLPEVPSEEMPGYLSAADCAIVPLRNQTVFRGALPSKLFEAWACSRPVVLSAAGEAAELVERAEGGLVVTPEDPTALANAIRHLASHKTEAQEMGRRGREWAVTHYSREKQACKLEELLAGVMRKT